MGNMDNKISSYESTSFSDTEYNYLKADEYSDATSGSYNDRQKEIENKGLEDYFKNAYNEWKQGKSGSEIEYKDFIQRIGTESFKKLKADAQADQLRAKSEEKSNAARMDDYNGLDDTTKEHFKEAYEQAGTSLSMNAWIKSLDEASYKGIKRDADLKENNLQDEMKEMYKSSGTSCPYFEWLGRMSGGKTSVDDIQKWEDDRKAYADNLNKQNKMYTTLGDNAIWDIDKEMAAWDKQHPKPFSSTLNEWKAVATQRSMKVSNDGGAVDTKNAFDDWMVFKNTEEAANVYREAYYKATGNKEDNPERTPAFQAWLLSLQPSERDALRTEAAPHKYNASETFEGIDVRYDSKTGEVFDLDIKTLRNKGVEASAILSFILAIKGKSCENNAKDKVDEMDTYSQMIKDANKALSALSGDTGNVNSDVVALYVKYYGKDPTPGSFPSADVNNAKISELVDKLRGMEDFKEFFGPDGKIKDDVKMSDLASALSDHRGSLDDNGLWPSIGTDADKIANRQQQWQNDINNFSTECDKEVQNLTIEAQDKNKKYDTFTSTASALYNKIMELELQLARNIS
ncbi:MAG: hypothetical protein A2Y14_02595 [Verrucomicrobia bacterium GWF2_51_19]|nr:MAG: hypothetical protein A2Y14_02595 [Verrucomicrobia bacterium GWF2_51_19]